MKDAERIAELEAVEVAGYLDESGTYYPSMDSVERYAPLGERLRQLMTVAQHQRILADMRQQRDKLAEALRRGVDHVTNARHDVEVRANSGNEAAKLVQAGIDSWLINDARAALSELTP